VTTSSKKLPVIYRIQYTVKNVKELSQSPTGNPKISRIKIFLAGNTSGISRLPGIFPLLIREKIPKAEIFPAAKKSFNK
jgi:hypothetical protein